MPGPVSTTPPFGVQDSFQVRALAVLGPNTRVKGPQGMMGTAADQLLFPGVLPGTLMYGTWTVPNVRVQIAGVRTIGASSQGMAFTVTGAGPVTTGPLFVSTPAPRISNT